jgi:hypothetical protein
VRTKPQHHKPKPPPLISIFLCEKETKKQTTHLLLFLGCRLQAQLLSSCSKLKNPGKAPKDAKHAFCCCPSCCCCHYCVPAHHASALSPHGCSPAPQAQCLRLHCTPTAATPYTQAHKLSSAAISLTDKPVTHLLLLLGWQLQPQLLSACLLCSTSCCCCCCCHYCVSVPHASAMFPNGSSAAPKHSAWECVAHQASTP